MKFADVKYRNLLQEVCRMFRSLNIAFPWTILIALAVAFQVPAVSQAANQRELPFENSRVFGLILVRVEANGRPAVLIVDTASNHTIISSQLADAPPRTLGNAISTSKGSGLTGTGVFTRATLKIGPITWRDHSVVVMNMHEMSKSFGQQIDGLLGVDFFSEFEVVTVDLKNHKIILVP